MFPQLSSVLGETEDSKLITIHEASTDKSSFVVHHFISRGVKNGKKVFIIGMEQSFGHYHSVGLKLGLNLLKLKESGQIIFYEGLKKILELSLNDSDGSNVLSSDNGSQPTLQALYKDIIEQMKDSDVVVFDNLTILLCLGHTPQHVFAFLHNLRSILIKRGCQFILRLSDLSSEHSSLHLISLVDLRSDVIIKVEDLTTGQSRDVSGCLTVKTGDTPRRNLQFQFEERGVRIFAPGTSAAVL